MQQRRCFSKYCSRAISQSFKQYSSVLRFGLGSIKSIPLPPRPLSNRIGGQFVNHYMSEKENLDYRFCDSTFWHIILLFFLRKERCLLLALKFFMDQLIRFVVIIKINYDCDTLVTVIQWVYDFLIALFTSTTFYLR